MKNTNAATLPLTAVKKSSGGIVHRTIGKSFTKKNWENQNWEKGIEVLTFHKKTTVRRAVTAGTVDENAVSVFKMSEKGSQKMGWDNLSDSHKKAFNEVINTFADKEKIAVTSEYYSGGCSFAYCDEEIDLSAVCIASQGKLMLFYKEF